MAARPDRSVRASGPHLPARRHNDLEYVQFAVKGAPAALICYVLFVGFNYPGIDKYVVTCFVVSLSTIESSNQKRLLRFGGAMVGV
jgi:multidrug resistance protein MdtO